jgi:hypothetical protein
VRECNDENSDIPVDDINSFIALHNNVKLSFPQLCEFVILELCVLSSDTEVRLEWRQQPNMVFECSAMCVSCDILVCLENC